MNDLKYLIINPLQIELNKGNMTERRITRIEKRFNDKIEKLKNIILQNNRLKYMIQPTNRRLILVDI
jgi:hypothetical protein